MKFDKQWIAEQRVMLERLPRGAHIDVGNGWGAAAGLMTMRAGASTLAHFVPLDGQKVAMFCVQAINERGDLLDELERRAAVIEESATTITELKKENADRREALKSVVLQGRQLPDLVDILRVALVRWIGPNGYGYVSHESLERVLQQVFPTAPVLMPTTIEDRLAALERRVGLR